MAYAFASASSQYLSVADTSALDITGAITIVCLVDAANNTTGNPKGLVAKWVGSGNQRSYNLSQSTTNKIQGAFSSDGTFQAANNLIATTDFSSGNWNHAAVVFSPSTSITGYLNGVQDGQVTSTIAASIYAGTADLWIGAQFGISSATLLDGKISEAAIYNTNLTADEIASLAKGFKPYRIRPQSLVFYAPLIRDLQDTKGALAITNNNTATVAVHPRVI